MNIAESNTADHHRFAKATDLRDVFAISEFFGYTGLVMGAMHQVRRSAIR